MTDKSFICKICGKSYGICSALAVHVKRTHKMEIKDYYDRYIDTNSHNCIYCGSPVLFCGMGEGYKKVCKSKDCQNRYKQEMAVKGCLKKYGVTNVFKLKSTTKKIKSTKLKKYGDENYNNPTKSKQTCLKKYGVEYNFQATEVREKCKDTCERLYGNRNYNGDRTEAVKKWKSKLPQIINNIKKTCKERYGVDSYTKTDEFKKKFKDTCNEHFGVDHNFQADSCIEKRKKTWEKHLGTDNPLKSSEVQEKIKSTLVQKYGVDNYSKTDEFKEKLENHMLETYGVKHYSQTDEFKEKCSKTCMDKFGRKTFFQSPIFKEHLHEYKAKMSKGIQYEGYSFDSQTEVDFYKWCKTKNFDIEYQPLGLEYTDSLGINHLYLPDFKVNGKLYEIKGPHLWKDGHLFTPYRAGLSEDELMKLDIKDLAKTKCLKENAVTILFSNEMTDEFLSKKVKA